MNDTPRPDAKAPETEPGAQNPQAEGAKPQVSKPYVDPSLMVDEAAEMKNRLLRALADMENLRKRTEREVADARQSHAMFWALPTISAVRLRRSGRSFVPARMRR